MLSHPLEASFSAPLVVSAPWRNFSDNVSRTWLFWKTSINAGRLGCRYIYIHLIFGFYRNGVSKYTTNILQSYWGHDNNNSAWTNKCWGKTILERGLLEPARYNQQWRGTNQYPWAVPVNQQFKISGSSLFVSVLFPFLSLGWCNQ